MRLPKCPVCQREVTASATNKSFPFCCPRCKLVDLGRWLGEGYSVPHVANPDDEEELDESPREYRSRSRDEDE